MSPEECEKKLARALDIIEQQSNTIQNLGSQIGIIVGLLDARSQELLDCLRDKLAIQEQLDACLNSQS